MKNTFLVSVGMPVYNDILFLEKAIQSILNQSFTDFEFIISDDFSIDGSQEVCLKYANIDKRIRYVRQDKNIGISRNMKFLLQKASGKYFMWAANDDLWDKDFILKLYTELEKRPDCIVAFGPTMFIDEDGNQITNMKIRSTNYEGQSSYDRIKKLIKIFDDCFGYGLFRREKILKVELPVWWWINRNCAYNNIYPTLAFYLAKGNFAFIKGKPIWFNRIKSESNINHKIPFNNTFLRGFFAFFLRAINLVCFSLNNILQANFNLVLVFRLLPFFVYYWIFIPSKNEFQNRLKMFLEGKVNFI